MSHRGRHVIHAQTRPENAFRFAEPSRTVRCDVHHVNHVRGNYLESNRRAVEDLYWRSSTVRESNVVNSAGSLDALFMFKYIFA